MRTLLLFAVTILALACSVDATEPIVRAEQAVCSGPSLLESRWALQPMAGGLSAPEVAQLAALRLTATSVTDFWGCQ